MNIESELASPVAPSHLTLQMAGCCHESAHRGPGYETLENVQPIGLYDGDLVCKAAGDEGTQRKNQQLHSSTTQILVAQKPLQMSRSWQANFGIAVIQVQQVAADTVMLLTLATPRGSGNFWSHRSI